MLAQIWRGLPFPLLLAGLTASFCMYHLWTIIQQIGEAVRETLFVQKLRLWIVLANFAGIAALGLVGKLSVMAFLLIIAVSHMLAINYFAFAFDWHEHVDCERREAVPAVAREFAAYCVPLAVVTLVTLLCAFTSRWLLQTLSGSVQQGYFSIGEQLSTAVLIFATSLSSIFWKEIASAHALGDTERMRQLFFKARGTLYFATCAVACFTVVFSGEIVSNILGSGYANMSLTLALMVLMPIPTCWGQLNTAYMYATGRTKIEMYFCVSSSILVTGSTYFMLASPSARMPGLALGSAGMAMMSVLVPLLTANAETLYIYKLTGWRENMSFQLRYPAILFALAYIAFRLTAFVPQTHSGFVLHLLLAGLIYLAGVLAYAYIKQKELGVGMDKIAQLRADMFNVMKLDSEK